jgi:hypothetical protein
MTPSRRWRQTNRPQTPRNSLLRRDFCGNRPEQKVKKIVRRFERSARVLRLINVGAVIPPHRLYSARAPIHPKRPYSLTRPVVPPDGSFIFGTRFLEETAPLAVPRKLLATRFSFACVIRNFTVCAIERTPTHASQRGHAAGRLDGG